MVVREIRSGKTPGVGLAVTALMMLKGGKGKFLSNLPCMLLGGVNSFVVSQAMGALANAAMGSSNPVHASTGAKVLGGPEELDFACPASCRSIGSVSTTAGTNAAMVCSGLAGAFPTRSASSFAPTLRVVSNCYTPTSRGDA